MGHTEKATKAVGAIGPPVFIMETKTALQTVPDTAGKTEEEIEAMPKYVRSFRCEKNIESGEPCKKTKFSYIGGDEPCNQRKYRVSWHPGWYVCLPHTVALCCVYLTVC